MTLTILPCLLPSRAILKLALRCGVLGALLLALLHRGGHVFAQADQKAQPLELGKPLERELAGGQSHAYRLTLSAGQYLHVVVEQRGIDVVVTLFGPAGQKLLEVDSPNGTEGPEPLRWIVETAGLYRLEVRSLENDAKPGRYEVKLVELRAATSRDRDLAEAEKLYDESVSLRQKAQYNQAFPLASRALSLREKALDAEHPDIAVSLNNLALLYIYRGDYTQAEPLYRRALAIREKVFGGEHPDTATYLNNLAYLYKAKSEYAQAEPLYRRALAIREKILGEEHPDTATSLNNLATLYDDIGDYTQAELLYRRALTIREKVLGAEHPDMAESLNNLAYLYKAKGDYTQAEPLYRRALTICENLFGAEHPNTATLLNNLAELYFAKGDYAQAEPLYRRALAIREKVLGREHLDTVISLNNLANLYLVKGDYVQAEPLYRRGLAIYEKVLGADHLNIAVLLNNLATLYENKGDYRQAEPLYRRALAIRENVLGAEHPDTAQLLNNLAILYEVTSDISRAVIFRSRAQAIEERNIALNLATGSERQKIAYLKTLANTTAYSVRLHVRLAPADPTARDLALTAILQRKGRVLEALNDGTEALRRRAQPQDRALLDQLKAERAQLAKLVLGGPQRVSPAEHRQAIKRLEESVEKLEADISSRSLEFRLQAQPVTIAAVQAAIPPDAALIEFFRYDYKEARYVAYVLRHSGGAQWVDLGEAAAIEQAVDKLRQALRDPARQDVKQLARAVDQMVMQPLRVLLGDMRRVFISPDGALNPIPFAALTDEQNRYLVERYELSYLTSGRDLLRLQLPRASRPDVLVVADPDFGETAAIGRATNRRLKYGAVAQTGGAEGSILADAYFPPLAGTAEEARALKALLPEATVLTREQATEAALKQASSPRILHIATHGFFLADIKDGDGKGRELKQVSFAAEQPANQRVENPLLRSGLALAGANRLKSGDDDGILTAMEAAGLDLWGTKLVVLSACETGLGDVQNGEGVYGLRRALVLAGSETQVMSLWPVSDKATRDLMIEYYRALQNGEGRTAALRNVQLKMLNRQKQEGAPARGQGVKKNADKTSPPPPSYSHPYYWASFIQSGEWANLEGKRD